MIRLQSISLRYSNKENHMPADLAALREVRKHTAASLTICRQALEQTQGDSERAIQLIREQQIQLLIAHTGATRAACAEALRQAEGDLERAELRLRSNPSVAETMA